MTNLQKYSQGDYETGQVGGSDLGLGMEDSCCEKGNSADTRRMRRISPADSPGESREK